MSGFSVNKGWHYWEQWWLILNLCRTPAPRREAGGTTLSVDDDLTEPVDPWLDKVPTQPVIYVPSWTPPRRPR